jgi:hypothetical protein
MIHKSGTEALAEALKNVLVALRGVRAIQLDASIAAWQGGDTRWLYGLEYRLRMEAEEYQARLVARQRRFRRWRCGRRYFSLHLAPN